MRYWKKEVDGLELSVGRPYARSLPDPSYRSANWIWSQSSRTSLICPLSNSRPPCLQQDEDSISIAPFVAWPSYPHIKGRKRILSSTANLYRIGCYFWRCTRWQVPWDWAERSEATALFFWGTSFRIGSHYNVYVFIRLCFQSMKLCCCPTTNRLSLILWKNLPSTIVTSCPWGASTPPQRNHHLSSL